MLSILFALVLVAAACRGGDDDEATSFEESDDAAAGDAGEEGVATEALAARDAVDAGGVGEAESEESGPSDGADQPALGTGGADVGALQPVDIGRDSVFTAQIEVAVDDVVVAGRQALTVIESLGGLLFGQETSVADTPRTVLVFKVAPNRFQTAVARLGEVGVLTEQVITADDVTERIVDLESRIVTAQASVERLRAFLTGATELEQVASLERELLTRETDLELLRGQLRTLQGQVDLATITVVLTQARAQPGLTVEVRYAEGSHEVRDGCSGDKELTVGEGDVVTVCVEVRNDGDTMLTGIDVVHRDLDLELDDFVVVAGDLTTPLEPSAAIVLAASFEAGPSIFGSARASAIPVDANGADLGFGTVDATGDGRLDVEQELNLPGVAAAFSAGWNALAVAANVVILGLAVTLPFLWIPVLVWLASRWWARRRNREAQAVSTIEGPS
jgi:hypothetical protein